LELFEKCVNNNWMYQEELINYNSKYSKCIKNDNNIINEINIFGIKKQKFYKKKFFLLIDSFIEGEK